MIDSHCHLDSVQFEVLPDVSGLEAVITSGASIASSKRCVEIASKLYNVYATVGLGYEPKYRQWERLEKEIGELCKNKKVVGIGECGIDSDNLGEEELLAFHVKIAKALDLPLVVHNRRQDEKVLSILGDYPKVMIHCFTSDMAFMEECVRRGWYVSFGGIVTFKKSEELREVVKRVPEDKLLIETDAPYLAPEPVRGSRNVPANVKIIAKPIAEIRGTSIEKIEDITTRNAKRLFDI